MKKNRIVAIAASTVLLAGMCWSADWWPFGKKDTRSKAPIVVDESPLLPEVKAATSVAPMLKKVSNSVVRIQSTKVQRMRRGGGQDDPRMPWFFRQMPQMPDELRQQGEGSGVIVSADGYILTNNHVIEGADEISVMVGDGSKEYTATVIGRDPRTDLAVVKVDADKLTPITLGDSDLVEVGDKSYAVGNPFGVGMTVTSGMVSAINRRGLRIVDYENFIQTDASINPGNSGGALIDAQGRLIGINTAIFSRSGGAQGIGFAIPSNLARQVMGQLLKNGRVARGFLGVRIQPLDDDLREAFKAKGSGGALVSAVEPNSAASEAGLEPGDVIVSVAGKEIADVNDLRLSVARIVPGTKIPVVYLRDGKSHEVEAKLKELPEQNQTGATSTIIPGEEPGLLKGVTIAPLTDPARERVELPEDASGVLVTGVDPSSVGAQSGLMPGDVIVEIARKAVDEPSQARRIARDAGNRKLLLRVWREGRGQYLVLRKR